MNDDGLDLNNEVDKGLYDAGRAVITKLIESDANPDDGQWRHDFLHNVAEFRNYLTQIREDGRNIRIDPFTPVDEFMNGETVQALVEEHRQLTNLLITDSVSTTALTTEARRFAAAVGNAREVRLKVIPGYSLLGIDISGEPQSF